MVALVGCPNVGKSTLSDRLTRTRDALVADFPGLTRDRKYDHVEVEGHGFICVGAGRIDGAGDSVETHMAEQSLLTIEETDVILSMVDARAGLMLTDEAIAKHLCFREKPAFLMTNKINGLDPDQAVVDFYSLGLGGTYPIATSHGRGVLGLLEHVLLPWMEDLAPREGADEDAEHQAQFEAKENGEEEGEDDFDPQGLPIRLAIVGRPNVGKSTLANRILGEERVVACGMPGTARDSIYIPMERDGRGYVLVDTAGVRGRDKITGAVEKFSVTRMLQAIEDANVMMLVINAREGISGQDLSLLGFILNSGRSLVVMVNKWGGLSQGMRGQVKETLDFRLGFVDFVRMRSISALHGSGIGNLFESIRGACGSSTRRAGTSILTRIMAMAVEDHQPPLVHGCRVKPKYAHAGGYNPPIVVTHGNQVKDLPNSYKHYLMNYFHKLPDVMGSPIRIQFREGRNPYANRRSTLTPTQVRERKRLMKRIKENK